MYYLSAKEQIRVLYSAGEKTVITRVQGLLDKISQLELLVESQEKRILVLEEQLKRIVEIVINLFPVME